MIQTGEQAQLLASRQPFFSRTYTTGSDVAAGGVSSEVYISEEDEWQYAPFDTMLITNTDTVPLAIRLDGNPDNKIPVAKGQTVGASDQKFRNFTVENLDGTSSHTAGKVLILVQQTKRSGEE